jgi:hypothetical protein
MDPASRLESGPYSLRPDSGRFPLSGDFAAADDAPSGRIPLPRSRAWSHRAGRFLKRRGRFLLLVLGSLVVLDGFATARLCVSSRATALVLVSPARRLDSELRAVLPALPDRTSAVVAGALSDAFLKEEILATHPGLAQVDTIREAFDAQETSATERLRERIQLAVEGGDRPIGIRITVRGEHSGEVAAVASRVAARVVALDDAFLEEDARSRVDRASREAAPGAAAVARASAELDASRRANPDAALPTDAALRAELAELEARGAQEEAQEAELAAALPLLDAEEGQRRATVQDEAELARRASREAAAPAPPRSPPSTQDPADAEAHRARLASLEAELARERVTKTDRHADVRRLLDAIALERASSRSAVAQAPPSDATGLPPPDEATASGVVSVELSRFFVQASGFAAWRDVKAKLEGTRAQLRAVHAKVAARNSELERLRARLDRYPEARARLARLEAERDHRASELESARRRVELAERLSAVELGKAADGARLERLVLADPLVRLEGGLSFEALAVFLVGVALSIGIALGAAEVRELRDRSLHSSEDVVQELGLPVLGVIPRLRGRR